MEELLANTAAGQGIWTVVSIFLLFYTLKSQEKRDKKTDSREEKYQETINTNQSIIKSLTNKLNVMEQVKQDVEDIKDWIKG